jgi:uncharacterized protein (DUF2384 family)
MENIKQNLINLINNLDENKLKELLKVITLGLDTFGNIYKFKHWLNSPSIALEGKMPIDLLNNSHEIDLVLNELNCIDHGIFC